MPASPRTRAPEPVGELGELGLVGRAPVSATIVVDRALCVRHQPVPRGQEHLGAGLEAGASHAGWAARARATIAATGLGAQVGHGRDRLAGGGILDGDSRASPVSGAGAIPGTAAPAGPPPLTWRQSIRA